MDTTLACDANGSNDCLESTRKGERHRLSHTQAVVDLFLVGSFATSAIAFAANTETYLDVVRSLAGKETGVGLLDRAKLAQESAKVRDGCRVRCARVGSGCCSQRSADSGAVDTLWDCMRLQLAEVLKSIADVLREKELTASMQGEGSWVPGWWVRGRERNCARLDGARLP